MKTVKDIRVLAVYITSKALYESACYHIDPVYGYNKLITCSSMIRKLSDRSQCWLRGDIDYGVALKSDIEFRCSILDLHSVNDGLSDTHWPFLRIFDARELMSASRYTPYLQGTLSPFSCVSSRHASRCLPA